MHATFTFGSIRHGGNARASGLLPAGPGKRKRDDTRVVGSFANRVTIFAAYLGADNREAEP
jgi:hypothetical protein